MTTPAAQPSTAPNARWQTVLTVLGACVGLVVLGLKGLALVGSLSSLFATYSVDNLQFVDQQATSFGQTRPIAHNKVQQGQRFALYFEPQNFATRYVDGHLSASLIVDLDVLDAQGRSVDTVKAIHTVNYRIPAPNSRHTIRNAYANMQFNGLSYAPGTYTLRLTLTDRYNDQQTVADMPFEMIAGAAPAPASDVAPRARARDTQASTPRIVN